MGGATITKFGKTEKELLKKMSKPIIDGLYQGLKADEDLVIFDWKTGKSTKIFKVEYNYDTTQGHYIEFIKIERGNFGVAVQVSAMFHKGKEPKDKPLIACIHLHT